MATQTADDQPPPSPGPPPGTLPAGYPSLARRTSLVPEGMHVRSFAELSYELLLEDHAELAELEKDYRDCQRAIDGSGDPELRRCTRDRVHALEVLRPQMEQLRKSFKEKSSTYYANLFELRQLYTVNPNLFALKGVQNFLAMEMSRDRDILSREVLAWGSDKARKSYARDLIAVLPAPHDDIFSRFVSEKVVDWLVQCFNPNAHEDDEELVVINDVYVRRVTFFVQSTLASLLPVASVIVLYCVKSMVKRFVVLAVSNLLFAWTLGAFASLRRSEVFAIAAAQVFTRDLLKVLIY